MTCRDEEGWRAAPHAVIRMAGPVTTFLVGYARATAGGAGNVTSDAAVSSAEDVAFQLCRDAGKLRPAHKV